MFPTSSATLTPGSAQPVPAFVSLSQVGALIRKLGYDKTFWLLTTSPN